VSAASGERHRLFVAFFVPGPQLAALHAGLEELRAALPHARWIPPADQHVTLKFIGSVPALELAAIGEVCAQVAASSGAARVRLAGAGAFPRSSRARVLWAGVEDGSGITGALAARLDEGLASVGVPAEKRAFTSHLTLARFRDPVRLPMLPPLPEAAQETFSVASFELFRSHLSGAGARYQIVERYDLGSKI
jgi:2'-5' RNA ligase